MLQSRSVRIAKCHDTLLVMLCAGTHTIRNPFKFSDSEDAREMRMQCIHILSEGINHATCDCCIMRVCVCLCYKHFKHVVVASLSISLFFFVRLDCRCICYPENG